MKSMIVYTSAKLDGVGPVDNRPSPEQLHHDVQKQKEQEKWNKKMDGRSCFITSGAFGDTLMYMALSR